jgi:hypothetical protein
VEKKSTKKNQQKNLINFAEIIIHLHPLSEVSDKIQIPNSFFHQNFPAFQFSLFCVNYQIQVPERAAIKKIQRKRQTETEKFVVDQNQHNESSHRTQRGPYT